MQKKLAANLKSHKKMLHKQRRLREIDRRDMVKWYQTNADVLAYLETILLDGTTILPSYSLADSARDLDTLRCRISAEGLSFATKTLPSLMDNLLNYLENGISDYPGFKKQPGEKYPAFLRQLFSQIYVPTDDESEATALSIVYQLCSAFKKIEGPYPQTVLRKELADFVKVDESLEDIDFSSEHLAPILEHARSIINVIFSDFDIFDHAHAMPHPGPGATNTPVEKHMRYEPHVLYKQHDDVMPYADWFYNSPWHVVEQARSYLALEANKVDAPRARHKFVHKKVGKPRGICIEENESQYLQQAVKEALYYHLEHCPETKGRVNFRWQSINQRLALSNSITKFMATIDMSAASDRVARLLVSHLFRDQPDLHNVLMALSTRYVDFDRDACDIGLDSIELKKFAPMGSGLCFPVMAIVHYALCKAIILLSSQEGRFNASKKVFVYGDDIILPTAFIPAIYDWLPEFGMKLNVEKSFYKSHFRESCGVHAYKGYDITPIYFKSIVNHQSPVETCVSAISKEYSFLQRGYYMTAKLIRKRVTANLGPLPYVGCDSPVLGWNRSGRTDLQRFKPFAEKVRYRRIPAYSINGSKFVCVNYKGTFGPFTTEKQDI